MENLKEIHIDEHKHLVKTPFGPISFGSPISAAVVSWTDKNSRDLLVGRCWDGAFLYPSKELSDEELGKTPQPVTEFLNWTTIVHPIDWNNDGVQDLLVARREGLMYRYMRQTKPDGVFFEPQGVVRDAQYGLPLLVQYQNPNHPTMDSLSGYIEPQFFDYPMPLVYPHEDGTNSRDLILGDLAGRIWWLEDKAPGEEQPAYYGEKVEIKTEGIRQPVSLEIVRQLGTEYVRPCELICDESGEPFLLGDGMDSHVECYEGGDTRPVLYTNPVTGSRDLLVFAGMVETKLYYLRYAGRKDGKPFFENMGEVRLEGLEELGTKLGFHAKLVVVDDGEKNDLLIVNGSQISRWKNLGHENGIPAFVYDHTISGPDVTTSGYHFSGVLKNQVLGRRYLMENRSDSRWALREICQVENGEVSIASKGIPVRDVQQCDITVSSETDPLMSATFGFHRAFPWDYDGSGSQSQIIGTDKGLLYLLKVSPTEEERNPFRYEMCGPLKDTTGNTIKLHNRACAGGIDITGNGLPDLVAGGISYQMGIGTDPQPGGDFFLLRNLGIDEKGLPILSAPEPLPVKGHVPQTRINSHLHITVTDIDCDGEQEVILTSQKEDFTAYVYRVDKQEHTLVQTDRYLKDYVCTMGIMDIDDDGKPELVLAGGEQGIALFQKIEV